MRSIDLSRRLEEASCGVGSELLNRGSGVRVPAPAPLWHPCGVDTGNQLWSTPAPLL